MRRLSLFAVALCVTSMSVAAQTATTALPAQTKTTTSDTLTSSFNVDGIPVILRRNTSNNVVAVNVYLLGGVRQVTRATAGIEPFLLSVSERGTLNYSKAVLRRKVSLLGSDFVVAPSVDWTLFGTRTITTVLDSTWAIFADRLMRPALQPAEVELVRAQALSAVRQERDDPDQLASDLADSVAFAGTPYAIPVTGTEESLRAITAADLRAYEQSQIVKSRMLVVVVGNVTRPHLESLIHQTLGKLPAGTYQWTLPTPMPVTPPSAVLVQRDLPTNYILGYFAGPLASSPEYTALRVASTVLTGQMFAEIRGRQNLTYDVHAPFLERAASASGLYVTTVAPDTTLKLMRFFTNQLKQETVTDEGLDRLELQFITQYFLDNETNGSQADFLARSQLYQGDYRHAARFVAELKSVTPEAVRAAARKYVKNFHWAYVGDTRKVNRQLLESF
ncbi:MAG: M16 family metallopeptidase [Gemmatimonadaceae bacterium]